MADQPAPDDAPATASKRSAVTTEAASALGDGGGTLVGKSVTINKPVAEVFNYFRDFANLPHFMENVVSIEVRDPKLSHWVVKAPGGKTVEWDSRVTDEAPNQFIAWESQPGADVQNAGRIEFRDAGARGTVVTLNLVYDPPAGVVGKLIAKLFQREPAIQARRDLRRFKQLLETGEIATPAKNREEFEEMGL
jgi:uncharacterized membrane protein